MVRESRSPKLRNLTVLLFTMNIVLAQGDFAGSTHSGSAADSPEAGTCNLVFTLNHTRSDPCAVVSSGSTNDLLLKERNPRTPQGGCRTLASSRIR